jgi:hypothetical protein
VNTMPRTNDRSVIASDAPRYVRGSLVRLPAVLDLEKLGRRKQKLELRQGPR